MRIIKNILLTIVAVITIVFATAGYLAYQAGHAVVDGVETLLNPDHVLDDGLELEFPEDNLNEKINRNNNAIHETNLELEKTKKDAERIKNIIRSNNSTYEQKIEELTLAIGNYAEASEQERNIINESIITLQESLKDDMDGLEQDIQDSKENNEAIAAAIIEDYNTKLAIADSIVRSNAKVKAAKVKADRIARMSIINRKEINKYERKLRRTNNPDKRKEYKRILSALKGE